MTYRDRVRRRIEGLYEDGSADSDRCIGRALWIGFEHEGEAHHEEKKTCTNANNEHFNSSSH